MGATFFFPYVYSLCFLHRPYSFLNFAFLPVNLINEMSKKKCSFKNSLFKPVWKKVSIDKHFDSGSCDVEKKKL